MHRALRDTAKKVSKPPPPAKGWKKAKKLPVTSVSAFLMGVLRELKKNGDLPPPKQGTTRGKGGRGGCGGFAQGKGGRGAGKGKGGKGKGAAKGKGKGGRGSGGTAAGRGRGAPPS